MVQQWNYKRSQPGITTAFGLNPKRDSFSPWTQPGSCCCCSVAQSCLTLCYSLWPMNTSVPDFPVLHCLPEFAQTHVHWVSDAIQPPHPLSPPSPPAFNLSQHQSLFQWVSSSYQVAKVLELRLQSFMNTQGRFLLGLTGLISLLSKGL